MFELNRIGENRIDLAFGGRLVTEEMEKVLDELSEKTKGIEDGVMLVEIHDYKLPTLGAIGLELSRLPEMFKVFRRFRKAAVLADESWVRAISEIEGMIIPGLDIDAYKRDQKEAAIKWLGED